MSFGIALIESAISIHLHYCSYYRPDIKNLTAVWASLSDKQPELLIKEMSPYISKLYTVDIFGSRAVPKQELADMAKKYIADSTAAESLEKAVTDAITSGEDLIVFGSLYLASDARNIIIEKL